MASRGDLDLTIMQQKIRIKQTTRIIAISAGKEEQTNAMK